jgi:hypothetical protein
VRGHTTFADLCSALLAHLRRELHAPDLTYADPPAAIGGGYDLARLPYFEAAACMRGLVRAGEARAAGAAAAVGPLDASSFGEGLAARFARVSGVAVPPRAG